MVTMAPQRSSMIYPEIKKCIFGTYDCIQTIKGEKMKALLIGLLSICLISCVVTRKEHDGDIDELKTQIAQLQLQLQTGANSVSSLTMALNQSRELIASLEDQVYGLLVSNNANTSEIQELQDLITVLQDIAVNQQAALAQLSSGLRVVGVIDFCGETPSAYNEVGLRMSDGSTLAYFENGGKRFITALKPSTSYQTTDGTNCQFTTNASGLVCDQYGCR